VYSLLAFVLRAFITLASKEQLVTKQHVNISMGLRELESEGVDWMHLAQDRDQWRALVNTVMNFWVP
jgi:hypothetical protein